MHVKHLKCLGRFLTPSPYLTNAIHFIIHTEMDNRGGVYLAESRWDMG